MTIFVSVDSRPSTIWCAEGFPDYNRCGVCSMRSGAGTDWPNKFSLSEREPTD